jgi:hypothetical protein
MRSSVMHSRQARIVAGSPGFVLSEWGIIRAQG